MTDLRVKAFIEAIDRMSSPMRKMADNFVNSTDRMRRSMKSVGESMRSAGANITAGLSAPIAAFGLKSVISAGQIEQISISLEGLAGSAERTADLMKRLNTFAAQTPFELKGISTAAKMLLGTQKFSIEEIQDVLKATGDVASGSGSQIEEIAYILAKTASSGVAQAEELNMFLERGIPIYGALAKATGHHEKDIKKLAANGKISYQDLYKALKMMSDQGGIYGDMMKKQSVSIFGLWSTLTDSMTQSMGIIGQEINKEFKLSEKIAALSNMVMDWAQKFKQAPSWVKSTVLWVGLFLAILGPLLLILGQMLTTFAVLAVAAKILGVALMGLTGWGIVIVAAIAAIVAAGILLWKNWDKISAFFSQLWDNLKWVFKQGVDWIMQYIQPLIDTISSIKNGFGRFFGGGSYSINNSQNTIPAMSAPSQRVDTGGLLRIKVDSEGKASVVDMRPNNPSQRIQLDSGYIMSGAY